MHERLMEFIGRSVENSNAAYDQDQFPIQAVRRLHKSQRQERAEYCVHDEMYQQITELQNQTRYGIRGDEIYQALILGTRDYVKKNGFEKVVIGLSGGIDSALTATIAVDALGAENVICIIMPSKITSQTSLDDAERLAHNLGIKTETIPIDQIYQTYQETLSDLFKDQPSDATEENIQARIRGNLLMALSNKFGWLVIGIRRSLPNALGVQE